MGQMSSLEAPIRHVGAAAEDDDVEELREEGMDDLGGGSGAGGGFILPMPFSKWVNRSLTRDIPDPASS